MNNYKKILLTLLLFANITLIYGADEEFNWGESRENILKTSKEMPSEEKWGLKYINQKVFNQKCHISYFFNDNKLWKIRLSFINNSNKNVNLLRNKLTAIYGKSTKKDIWSFKLTDILLKQDKNFIYIFYQNNSVAEIIKHQIMLGYISDL